MQDWWLLIKSCWGGYASTRQAAGLLMLLLNVFIIVASAQFTQYVFTDINYYKPLFFTYFNSTFMVILLARPLLCKVIDLSHNRMLRKKDKGRNSAQSLHQEANPELLPPSLIAPQPPLPPPDHSAESIAPHAPYAPHAPQDDVWLMLCSLVPTPEEAAALMKHMRHTLWPIVLRLTALYYVSNWVYSWSLALTSVSSNQILYQSSTLFAYILSIIFLKEKPSWIKTGATIVCIGGVILITLVDMDTSNASLFKSDEVAGDLLAIFGSFLFALYLTLFKKFYEDTKDTEFECFVYFGMVGLVCALFAWPWLFIFHHADWETFRWPDSAELVGFMIVNAALASILTNYFFALGVLWTSPLMANLVNSFTIPVAILSDTLLWDADFPPLYILGMILIFISFITVTIAEARDEAKRLANEEKSKAEEAPTSPETQTHSSDAAKTDDVQVRVF